MRRVPDIAPVAALAALACVELVGGRPDDLAAVAALNVAMVAPLVWRRRAPVPVLVLVLVAIGALSAVTSFSQASVPLAIGFAMFAVGRHADLPLAFAGPAILAAPAVVLAASGSMRPNEAALGLLTYGGVWAFGVGLRRRHRETIVLSERVVRAEEEREERAREAVETERAQIARELHDIVSHAISLIAIQAQAIRFRLGPEAEEEARDLAAMETVARDAMAEMRRLLGVLRTDGDGPPMAPQPGLDELGRLVDRTRAAGLPVEVVVEGDAGTLPAGLDLTAYRIVQEALTNVRRHAGASLATVTLRHGEAALDVLVEDDGRGAGADHGFGHGLVGMRERVALYGGTLETGPRREGGFHVHAHLPLARTALA